MYAHPPAQHHSELRIQFCPVQGTPNRWLSLKRYMHGNTQRDYAKERKKPETLKEDNVDGKEAGQ